MDRGRTATLVVVDDQGTMLGVAGPQGVAQPWWQEAGPVVDAAPGVTVLRLLHAVGEGDKPMGGRVVYLVEADADAAILGRLAPWPGPLPADVAATIEERLEPDPLRHPWAEPGGPADDLAWVDGIAPITGPARQHRTWNLSAVWSIPTEAGTVWLKCIPPMFAHEAVVLDALGAVAPSGVPRMLGADGHRLLLAEMPGEDGYGAAEVEQVAMLEALVDLQAGVADRRDDLVADGVPDLRAEPLICELTALVDRVAPEDDLLRQLLAEAPERLAEADRFGPPDTVVHGDCHGGNCRRGVDPPVWFDWGDAFVGNALLDLGGLHRMAPTAVARWLGRWRDHAPAGADPGRAWEALQPLAELRMAWVYQRFLDNIEPSERIYHHDAVDLCIRQTHSTLAGH